MWMTSTTVDEMNEMDRELKEIKWNMIKCELKKMRWNTNSEVDNVTIINFLMILMLNFISILFSSMWIWLF